MSFFCNFNSDKCPGPIKGNPLNGLCEKACVEVNKVFDACMQQTQLTGVVLNLGNFSTVPTYPLTFISARNTVSKGTVSNLTVTPVQGDRPNTSRVKADIIIPVSVAYTDANNVEGTATATITVSKDVILCVPTPSIMPYDIEAVVSLVSTIGTYTGEAQFTIECCLTAIMKVVMSVELLITTYGYAVLPPCQNYTEEVCAGFFELPVYPE